MSIYIERTRTETGISGAERGEEHEVTWEETAVHLWLCSIDGIGAVSIRRLLEKAGSARGVLALSQEDAAGLIGPARALLLERARDKKRLCAAEDRLERYREKGIFFLPLCHPDYPPRLKEIPDPPVALYGKGRLPDPSHKAAAVIGTRECSEYGRQISRRFASGLAGAGVTVVSGMARGVDGAAGRAALDAGGDSVAVLGCGVDICYPYENKRLYERLEQEGCLLSEYPPQTRPEAGLFPPRNRIISGLSDLVLVTEAREKSGTLITVDLALEQGREVFAVPGRITDACSRGCNCLIAGGAGAALSVPQLLRALHVEVTAKIDGEKRQERTAPPASGRRSAQTASRPLTAAVLSALDLMPGTLDEIMERLEAVKERDGEARETAREGSAASLQEVMEELLCLCMDGRAACRGGQYFRTDAAVSGQTDPDGTG